MLSLNGINYTDNIGHTSFMVDAENHLVSINGDFSIHGNIKINSYEGASGTFTTADGKTVTVTNGIITSIT